MKTPRAIRVFIAMILLGGVGAGEDAFASGVPLGAAGGGFANEDYNVPIRYDQNTQLERSECVLDKLFATGVTRLTGEVRCIMHDSAGDECDAGTIAQQLKVVGGPTPRLVYSCRGLAKAVCPADYVWQGLDFSKLDPGPSGAALDCSTVGQCVYRWRNNIQWQRAWPTGQSAVSGVFCNPDVYDAVGDGACTVSNLDMKPGPTGIMPSYTIEQSTAGATATCTMKKNEPGGSKIKGEVTWQGTCVIRAPELAPPLKGCQ